MMKTAILSTLFATGCGLTIEHTATGPDIRVSVENMDETQLVDNTEGDGGQIRPDSGGGYNLKVSVLVMQGISKTKSDFKNSTLKSLSVGLAVVGGDPLPASPVLPDDQFDVTYTRKDPVVFTASDAGKMIEVTGDALDSNGVHSNVVDFTFTLAPPTP